MNKEKLLKEAKKRFPIGCKVSNKNLNLNCEFIITGDGFKIELEDSGDSVLINKNSVRGIPHFEGSSYTVYNNEEWAKVISYPTTITKEQKSKILQLIKDI